MFTTAGSTALPTLRKTVERLSLVARSWRFCWTTSCAWAKRTLSTKLLPTAQPAIDSPLIASTVALFLSDLVICIGNCSCVCLSHGRPAPASWSDFFFTTRAGCPWYRSGNASRIRCRTSHTTHKGSRFKLGQQPPPLSRVHPVVVLGGGIITAGDLPNILRKTVAHRRRPVAQHRGEARLV